MDQVLTQAKVYEQPTYQSPAIRIMTEEEILNSFQVTQAMVTWWVAPTSPCTC